MRPQRIYSTQTVSSGGASNTTDGVAVSGTSTFYSDPWTARDADGQALHLVWTGTPTGTFTLWSSSHPSPGLTNDNDWVQDTTIAFTNPAGSASKFLDEAGNSKAFWKRVKYVNASGSGTLSGYVTVPRLS